MLLLLGVAGLGVLYALSLPHFVQGGDTGELVAAADRLFVPHPPGYPLWLWLEHFWTRLINGPTLFWNASLLSLVFSLLTLAILGWSLRKEPVPLLLCLFTLGLSRSFSEAAILPDVFALHCFFTAATAGAYLFAPPQSNLRQIGIPFLFFLGLAHHLTLVFLFPLVLAVLYEYRNHSTPRRKFLLSGTVGIFSALGLYLTLFLCHPESPYSWGELTNISKLFLHFIRSDYGSFQLAPSLDPLSFKPLGFFLKSALLPLSGLLILSMIGIPRSFYQDRKVQVSVGCFILSTAFFSLTNVKPVGMGEEVLSRFHCMPSVQLVLLCSYALVRRENPDRRVFAGCALLSTAAIFFLALNIPHLLKLRYDSTFEELLPQLFRDRKSGVPFNHSNSK